ncbi:Hypothetical predicted protein [Olea europaea subsp. europaea]|uniref:Uncharacterized protein n=1 Tax=Olea europaea subsp. europaea TaxID=158383 RepID=A0A8S0R7Z2_OLEEU|nr:Hypothetical predicted protein [Olea europaea subsp. europaea]
MPREKSLMLVFQSKQGVQSFNAFDFLKEVISMVPVLGGSDATVEDTFVAKRRFVLLYSKILAFLFVMIFEN